MYDRILTAIDEAERLGWMAANDASARRGNWMLAGLAAAREEGDISAAEYAAEEARIIRAGRELKLVMTPELARDIEQWWA